MLSAHKAAMVKKYSIVVWFIGLYLLFAGAAIAQHDDNESQFFSYKRFYAQLDIFSNAQNVGKARTEVKAFMQAFADGVYAISAGEPEKAKAGLSRAREAWPEYFGTDFLLARVSEDAGNYALAAMYYKSYLNKLKAFHKGKYRISGPLMEEITPYNIESYDYAYTHIRDRMKQRGMDIDAVLPLYSIPRSFRYAGILILLGCAYLIMTYRVGPYLRRMEYINNPPEGWWACRKCATYNINPMKRCEKCGAKRVRTRKR